MKKFLNFLFNVAWVIFAGIGNALSAIGCGIISICCILPIFFGVPKVYFKAVPLVFAPAGKKVELHFGDAAIRNVIYLIFGGFANLIFNYLYGILLCCTIILIPLGLQQLKFAKYWAAPFKAEVIKK